jgi:hypothetical protein
LFDERGQTTWKFEAKRFVMLSRQLTIVSAGVTGVLLGSTIGVAIYTLLHTQGVEGLPVWRDGRIAEFDSKFALLLPPILFQLIICLPLIWCSFRWERLERYILGCLEAGRSGAPSINFDVGLTQRLVCNSAMRLQALLLIFVTYICYRLLVR